MASGPGYNLGRYRKQIGNAVGHDPEAEDYRDEVRDWVNQAIANFECSQDWNWRHRVYRTAAFPDMTWAYQDWGISQVGTPVRRISVTGLQTPDSFSDVVTARRVAQLQAAMLNNPVTPPESMRIPLGLVDFGFGTEEFLVEAVEAIITGGSTSVPSGFELFLDPRFGLGTNPKVADWAGTWNLKFLRYALPRDCLRVERVMVLGGSRAALEPWDPQRENQYIDLDPAVTGTPGMWSIDVAGGENTPGISYVPGSPGYPSQPLYGGSRFDAPEAPTTISLAAATTGALPVDKRLRYCYTWTFSGMESPPSPIAEITLSGAQDEVVVTMETLNEANYGRRRNLYRQVAEGPWRRIAVVLDPSDATQSDVGGQNIEPALNETVDPRTRDNVLQESAGYQWLRLWPRPTQVTDLEVRYFSRPRTLVADTDAPAFPVELHPIIFHAVVAQHKAQHNDMTGAAYHKAQIKEILDGCAGQYLRTSHENIVKSSSWGGSRRGPPHGPFRWSGDT